MFEAEGEEVEKEEEEEEEEEESLEEKAERKVWVYDQGGGGTVCPRLTQ